MAKALGNGRDALELVHPQNKNARLSAMASNAFHKALATHSPKAAVMELQHLVAPQGERGPWDAWARKWHVYPVAVEWAQMVSTQWQRTGRMPFPGDSFIYSLGPVGPLPDDVYDAMSRLFPMRIDPMSRSRNEYMERAGEAWDLCHKILRRRGWVASPRYPRALKHCEWTVRHRMCGISFVKLATEHTGGEQAIKAGVRKVETLIGLPKIINFSR